MTQKFKEWVVVEDELKVFNVTIFKYTYSVCGMKRLSDKGISKGNEWWKNDFERIITEK